MSLLKFTYYALSLPWIFNYTSSLMVAGLKIFYSNGDFGFFILPNAITLINLQLDTFAGLDLVNGFSVRKSLSMSPNSHCVLLIVFP